MNRLFKILFELFFISMVSTQSLRSLADNSALKDFNPPESVTDVCHEKSCQRECKVKKCKDDKLCIETCIKALTRPCTVVCFSDDTEPMKFKFNDSDSTR